MTTPELTLGSERDATTRYDRTHQWWPGYLIAAIVICVASIVGIIVRGALGEFMLAGAQVVPFAVLALLAYVGLRSDVARIFSLLWLGIVVLGMAGLALLLTLAPAVTPASTGNATSVRPGGVGGQLAAVALWCLVGLIVAVLVLLPPIRRLLSHIIPIDPNSFVHAVALSVVGGTLIIAFGQLIAAGSKPPLLEMVTNTNLPEQSTKEQLLNIVYPFLWTVPGALIAVGFPIVRRFGTTLRRLGLVRPSALQVLVGVVIALVLVGGVTLLDVGVTRVWSTMGWPRTNGDAFDKLLGAAMSPAGALLIGVTAGIGEELVVRGALQPRMGILLSNLFFTSLHAFQYGFDALLTVFIVGLVLGIVRKRTNTTTSCIVHGVYDFTLIMLTVLGIGQ